ncbi:hypothetical protein SAMN05428975_5655 [Mucilaginibacter sp. OK268]|uniref:hypothetical protein n=1 Tax=Mucilaginibacter sp. OK268 TaxID=1881048 RepID=UPI00088BC603|nr:hypothetical protein [Mucilaginibacter sp. OK268]SDQ01223.1 hypothetical protein SAMN05428975_5655 [Mucilaginibacter sp. OK268]
MANVYLENWIRQAELDYFTMFIKSWLPFNAWYMKDFYDESVDRTSDRAIIDYIKLNPNRYKDKIIALLRGRDDDALRFRNYLSQLHFELEAHTIPNEVERISFSTINLFKNPLPQKVISFGHHDYMVEFKRNLPKTQKRWVCQIITKRTSQTIHIVELFDWSLNDLHSHIDYIAIPAEKKQYLDACFLEMNPKKPDIIIVQPLRDGVGYKEPPNSITINPIKHLYFSNNYELVSKVIIELLYQLRCKLFHGELDPITANLGIYENAFYLQKPLIKELI